VNNLGIKIIIYL